MMVGFVHILYISPFFGNSKTQSPSTQLQLSCVCVCVCVHIFLASIQSSFGTQLIDRQVRDCNHCPALSFCVIWDAGRAVSTLTQQCLHDFAPWTNLILALLKQFSSMQDWRASVWSCEHSLCAIACGMIFSIHTPAPGHLVENMTAPCWVNP